MTSQYDTSYTHPVGNGKFQSLDTQHAAGIIVLGSLALLILIRRGFRGIGPVRL